MADNEEKKMENKQTKDEKMKNQTEVKVKDNTGLKFAAIGAGMAAITALGTVIVAEYKRYTNKRDLNSENCINEFVGPNKLNADYGDLIEILREEFCHWGVYMGCSRAIVHLCNLGDGKGMVKHELLSEVADGYKCRVNNLKAVADKYGLKRIDKKDICKKALEYVDACDEYPYDVTEWNCEHFATYCAYGIGFSAQSDNVNNNPLIWLASKISRSSSSQSPKTRKLNN